MKLDIADFLSEFKNKHKKIKYIANPGGAGDSMIVSGTFKLFKELGLDYSIHKAHEKYDGDVLVYAGGGNLIDKYNSCRKFLQTNHKDNEILILPHTISHCAELLNAFGSNVKIIARELVSYQYIKANMRHSENAFLADDMAFQLDVPEAYKNQSHIGECNVFREDAEKHPNIKIPEVNKDLQRDFKRGGNFFRPEHVAVSVDNVFSYLSKFTEINTNRLHMSIAGALLGRKVNLYPNSYYKNKAMFDFSIKDKFKNVQFIDSDGQENKK